MGLGRRQCKGRAQGKNRVDIHSGTGRNGLECEAPATYTEPCCAGLELHKAKERVPGKKLCLRRLVDRLELQSCGESGMFQGQSELVTVSRLVLMLNLKTARRPNP